MSTCLCPSLWPIVSSHLSRSNIQSPYIDDRVILVSPCSLCELYVTLLSLPLIQPNWDRLPNQTLSYCSSASLTYLPQDNHPALLLNVVSLQKYDIYTSFPSFLIYFSPLSAIQLLLCMLINCLLLTHHRQNESFKTQRFSGVFCPLLHFYCLEECVEQLSAT